MQNCTYMQVVIVAMHTFRYTLPRSVTSIGLRGLEPPFVFQIGPSAYLRLYQYIYIIAWPDKREQIC